MRDIQTTVSLRQHEPAIACRAPPPDSAPMSIELIRTPAGWVYPDPGPCGCGASAATCGWKFCRCAGASGGGHPAWRCRACDAVRTLGCVGAVPVPNEYGGRSGAPRT